MASKRIIIVGAGPAGLTAGWELAAAGHKVTILESDPTYVGGLAKTMRYKDVRFDIGAHRFFSKSPEIVAWWRDRLPHDFVEIRRLTRILYRGRFFEYPLRPWDAFKGLGPAASVACGLSYLRRVMQPIRSVRTFEDWVTNRFGDRLYRMFFKTYTEKVWGMPCDSISADWASQRIKGLSLGSAVANCFRGGSAATAKTLTDRFLYPRFGAGMLWERTRDEIVRMGGTVLLGRTVAQINRVGDRVESVDATLPDGGREIHPGDEFIVSIPLRDCVLRMNDPLPEHARTAAASLGYRDFMLVALLVSGERLFPDHWIYVHDPGVRVARIENFNNWTPQMGASGVTCLEMEYFCSRREALWNMPDAELLRLAAGELKQLQFAGDAAVVDGCVVRVEDAYPVYDASYSQHVAVIRDALGGIENLQTVGRNGMHKYNNQDHSMMTGMLAARNVCGAADDIWKVNTDAQYHEEHDCSERGVPRRVSS